MRTRHLLAALLLAAGAAVPGLSAARTDVSVGINIGPPPPPAAVVAPSAPPPGYVWAPGYWAWDGYRHVWVEGQWIVARPGFYWVPAHWERRGPRHYFVDGYWASERRHHGRRW